jgi:hypothetical protein
MQGRKLSVESLIREYRADFVGVQETKMKILLLLSRKT